MTPEELVDLIAARCPDLDQTDRAFIAERLTGDMVSTSVLDGIEGVLDVIIDRLDQIEGQGLAA